MQQGCSNTDSLTRLTAASHHGRSPHDGVVLVLLPRFPAAQDWAAASEAAAPTVDVRLSHRSSRPPASIDRGYQSVLYRRLRPGRLFWRSNGLLAGRALVRLVDGMSASGCAVNLVHSHFYADSPGLPHLLAQRNIPYVVSEHSSAMTSLNPTVEISRTGRKVATRLYRSASYVLPVSEFLSSEIRRRQIPGNLEVVPNPVDTELFSPAESGGADERIVCVARLDPVKQIELLLRAVARMSQHNPRVRLDIVGDGPSRAQLARFAHELGIADQTTFHGHVERSQIPTILGRATVFALSSHTENLPIAMLEALSCGLPVVGPDVGGIPEIVKGAPGALFEPGDAGSLANALQDWTHPSDGARQAAREVALARYSIDAVGQRLRIIYQNVLDGNSPGPA